MKTKLLTLSILTSLTMNVLVAQEKTTVKASNSDISDNLDLRAVATIFGDASNLEDFERRLNDPKTQISNLDLNNDNYVDYLRVIESVEDNVHLVVVQAVLDKDVFQDVATIEVARDRDNQVQVQVVGDVYMYGSNYIYEPVYVHTPIIYNTFWIGNYRPYYSSWYWNYYPSYYSYWNPYPIFRYRNHIHVHINFGHSYHYTSYRRCGNVYNNYYGRRGNGYERMHPNRSFTNRNTGYSNRQELDNNRTIRSPRSNNEMNGYNNRISSNTPRVTRATNTTTPRTRTEGNSPRYNNETRNTETPRVSSETRNRNEGTRVYSENRNNSSGTRSSVSTNGNQGNSQARSSSSRGGSSQGRSSAPSSNSNTRNSGSRSSGRG